MTQQIFVKELPSDPELLPQAEEFIIDIAQKVKLNEDKFNSLALSFSEAASNSIVHGNKLNKNKLITITVKVENGIMEIIIKDQGKGFDPLTVPDPTKPENILKDNGRGIHIMRSFLDDLKYNSTPDGMETILVFSLKN